MRLAADIERALLTEGLKEAVEKDLRLSLFVAGDVLVSPRDKLDKLLLTSHINLLLEGEGDVNAKYGFARDGAA